MTFCQWPSGRRQKKITGSFSNILLITFWRYCKDCVKRFINFIWSTHEQDQSENEVPVTTSGGFISIKTGELIMLQLPDLLPECMPPQYTYISSKIVIVMKKSQNNRNKGFSHYFCLIMEVSGSVTLTNGSRSGRSKNVPVPLWVRIRNSGSKYNDSTLKNSLNNFCHSIRRTFPTLRVLRSYYFDFWVIIWSSGYYEQLQLHFSKYLSILARYNDKLVLRIRNVYPRSRIRIFYIPVQGQKIFPDPDPHQRI